MVIFLPNQSPYGYKDSYIFAALPGFSGTAAGTTVICFIFSPVSYILKGMQIRICFKEDMATPATITTIWATFRDKFFPSEMHCTLTAIPGQEFNLCKIDKHKSFNGIFPL
jgi:hypothetical protein